MDRRKFLQQSLAVLAASSVFPPRLLRAKAGETVVVVGAGMAGVAAANRLQTAGCAVTVLEARNRTGGRIWTNSDLGFPIDLGASWIHGSEGNPITALANTFGAATFDTESTDDVLFDRRGREVRGRVYRKGTRIFNKILRQASRLSDELERDRPLSKVVKQGLRSLRGKQPRSVIDVVKWLVDSEITVAAGVEPSGLSNWYYDDDEGYDGQELVFPQGYVQIIDGLASGLSIQTGEVVQSITYDASSVTVQTNTQTLTADRVIVTVPLGVLKAGAISFAPALPEDYLEALAGLEMGLLNKIILQFPTAFWEEPGFVPGFIGNVRPGKGARQEIPEFINFNPLVGQPVLMGFSGGNFALNLESLSDTDAIELAMKTLRRMYGNDIPAPTGIVRSGWAADPYARGSYSHIPVGGFGEAFTQLAQPIQNRLFFAGEATTREFPGTVHGAYLTGIQQADAIISL